jgi:ATP phosphoribosyltransferase
MDKKKNVGRVVFVGAGPGDPGLLAWRAREALLDTAVARFGVVLPFGGPTSSGMMTLHCPPAQIYALASFLREHGAETVSVVSLDYVFDRANPLFARLEGFLAERI